MALTARASLADHYRVPSGSMEPTVHVGDHIVVSKLAYGLRVPLTRVWVARFAAPRRGDVVVLNPPHEDSHAPEESATEITPTVLLKRVVAVEGDLVNVRDGRVFLDARALEEPWASVTLGSGPDYGPLRVPHGKVLVLGDNRGNSRDGRTFGLVDVSDVLGRALAVVGGTSETRLRPL